MVKIYFCGSIRGGRQLASTYEKIIKMLRLYGKVLTEHLGDDNEIQTRDRVLSDRTIHDRDLQWIRESDVVVAEVTVASLGVGYEIGRAIEMDKPVLCLFNNGSGNRVSAMIAGSEGVKMHYYSVPDELKSILAQFISQSVARRTS
ncbi:MAG: nucleoside 2-deoxyribosyltransferase [Bacteroidales bacterium]|nr:nucleoside 2-deoxyribosyltransferase [Bacteroidales bacterium]